MQRAGHSLGGVTCWFTECDVAIPPCPLLPWRFCQSWDSPAPGSEAPSAADATPGTWCGGCLMSFGDSPESQPPLDQLCCPPMPKLLTMVSLSWTCCGSVIRQKNPKPQTGLSQHIQDIIQIPAFLPLLCHCLTWVLPWDFVDFVVLFSISLEKMLHSSVLDGDSPRTVFLFSIYF